MKKFNYDELTRGEKSKYSRASSRLWDLKHDRTALQYDDYRKAQDLANQETDELVEQIKEAEKLRQQEIKEQIKALQEQSDLIYREHCNKINKIRDEARDKHNVGALYEVYREAADRSYTLYLEQLEELKQSFLDKE